MAYIRIGFEAADKNHRNYEECMEALRQISDKYSAVDMFDRGIIAYEEIEPLRIAMKEIEAVWLKYGFAGKDVYIFAEPICAKCGKKAYTFDDKFCSNCASRLPAFTRIN